MLAPDEMLYPSVFYLLVRGDTMRPSTLIEVGAWIGAGMRRAIRRCAPRRGVKDVGQV